MDFGSLLWNLIIGLIVGVLARFLRPERRLFQPGRLDGYLPRCLVSPARF